jgi:integrase
MRKTREITWRETARILGFKASPEDASTLVRSDGGGEVLRKWKGRNIQDIKRGDVIELLNGIEARGRKKKRKAVTVNRVQSTISGLFAWAIDENIVEESPCMGIRRRVKEIERNRVLTDGELRTIWAACDRVGWPYGPMVKLLALTAQRRNEVAGMRWSEIDLKGATWTLPSQRVKNNTEHVVPLAAPALAILSSLPRIGQDFVLTVGGKRPLGGFGRGKARLDAAIRELADETLAPPWTFHDLRRSATTGMARLNFPPHVVDKVLNHRSGTIRGVAAVYNRFAYLSERRVALDAWARFVELVMDRDLYSAHQAFLSAGDERTQRKSLEAFNTAIAEGGKAWARYLEQLSGEPADEQLVSGKPAGNVVALRP